MSNDLRDMVNKLDKIVEKTNLNESEEINEITGLWGAAKGFFSGTKQREKILRDWKEYLSQYRSSGNIDDLKTFLKKQGINVPTKDFNIIVKNLDIDSYTDEDAKIPTKSVLRFFDRVNKKMDAVQSGNNAPVRKQEPKSDDSAVKPTSAGSTKAGDATKTRKEPTLRSSGSGDLDSLRQKVSNSDQFSSSEREFLNKILSKDVLNRIMKK